MNISFSIPALDSIAASVAQLVPILKQSLQLQIKQMTIDDSVVQQLVDALNAAVLNEGSEATLNASLQAQLAPNPTLLASVTAALANASAATPPATPVTPVVPVTPVPPVVDPNATNPDGSLVSGNVTNADGSITTPGGTVIPAPVAAS